VVLIVILHLEKGDAPGHAIDRDETGGDQMCDHFFLATIRWTVDRPRWNLRASSLKEAPAAAIRRISGTSARVTYTANL
jgi:hypothetical protein